MFEDVIDNYKRMSLTDKRVSLLKELKIMVAVFDKMCVDNGVEYRKIQSNEIFDVDGGKETEDDYLEAAFIYVQYLKEVLGSYLENKGI